MKHYKLNHRDKGYKCLVTLEEINYLFGYNAETIEEAGALLIQEATGYYIEL